MLLGIDYGKARIGLSISDSSSKLARHLIVLKYTTDEKAIDEILSIVNRENIDTIVIGIPLGEDAKDTQMSAIISKFAERLERIKSGLKLIRWNETLTSYQAYENLLEKGLNHKQIKPILDMESARIILQEYLDSI